MHTIFTLPSRLQRTTNNQQPTTMTFKHIFLFIFIAALFSCKPAPKNDTAENSETTQTTTEQHEVASNQPYHNVDVPTFKKMMSEDVLILDVRTPAEANEGMIKNAKVLNVENPVFSEIVENFDREKTYLIYCQSGGRSVKACELLAEKGFTNLYNLEGGYEAWK